MKKCIRCKKEQELSCYGKRKGALDGHKNKCKSCFTEISKLSHLANPTLRKREWLKRTYNITLEQYEDMFKSQNNQCKICGRKETSINHYTKQPRALAVDHCHDTLKVRGLLCTDCNTGLGCFLDNQEVLTKAILYLQGKL